MASEIPTTHVGSLPRSDRLRDLLADPEARGCEAFEAAVQAAVRRIVRKQAEAGVDIANAGEQSRISYSVDTTNRLTGFGEANVTREWPEDLDDFPEYGKALLGATENIDGPVATGAIDYVGESALQRELQRFPDAVDAEDVDFAGRFHTAPSPGAVMRFADSNYHASNEEYLFDLADALHTEYALILDTGATLQIDAPDVLAGYTLTYKDATIGEFREAVQTHIEVINRAVEGLPADQIRLHACWGNYPGPHHLDVELSDVIDEIYQADVSALVVEGANPRHQNTYETFEKYPLPADWQLVPGVIDVKTNIIEHPEVVANRLERFSNAVGDPSRLVAGADCGFETVVEGANVVHPTLVWKKLEALVDGAALASERLF